MCIIYYKPPIINSRTQCASAWHSFIIICSFSFDLCRDTFSHKIVIFGYHIFNDFLFLSSMALLKIFDVKAEIYTKCNIIDLLLWWKWFYILAKLAVRDVWYFCRFNDVITFFSKIFGVVLQIKLSNDVKFRQVFVLL